MSKETLDVVFVVILIVSVLLLVFLLARSGLLIDVVKSLHCSKKKHEQGHAKEDEKGVRFPASDGFTVRDHQERNGEYEERQQCCEHSNQVVERGRILVIVRVNFPVTESFEHEHEQEDRRDLCDYCREFWVDRHV